MNSRELIDVIARLASSSPPRLTNSAPATQAVTLDESILEDLARLGGTGFVQELVSSFGEDSLRGINEVERALITQDYSLWHDQLHMLKGGASDIGACQLARLCNEAERIKPFEIASRWRARNSTPCGLR